VVAAEVKVILGARNRGEQLPLRIDVLRMEHPKRPNLGLEGLSTRLSVQGLRGSRARIGGRRASHFRQRLRKCSGHLLQLHPIKGTEAGDFIAQVMVVYAVAMVGGIAIDASATRGTTGTHITGSVTVGQGAAFLG
jgi:hypothetical protein